MKTLQFILPSKAVTSALPRQEESRDSEELSPATDTVRFWSRSGLITPDSTTKTLATFHDVAQTHV